MRYGAPVKAIMPSAGRLESCLPFSRENKNEKNPPRTRVINNTKVVVTSFMPSEARDPLFFDLG